VAVPERNRPGVTKLATKNDLNDDSASVDSDHSESKIYEEYSIVQRAEKRRESENKISGAEMRLASSVHHLLSQYEFAWVLYRWHRNW